MFPSAGGAKKSATIAREMRSSSLLSRCCAHDVPELAREE
jgi:hypothetical protein